MGLLEIMHIDDIFGQRPNDTKESEKKIEELTPFSFVNAINFTKEDLFTKPNAEKSYQPFIVNKALSYNTETIFYANEMNARPHLSKHAQNSFLLNIIKPKKRFDKWVKVAKVESIDIIKRYFSFSNEKAYQAASILTEAQIEDIKKEMNLNNHEKDSIPK